MTLIIIPVVTKVIIFYNFIFRFGSLINVVQNKYNL